ncbi:hypothetical protein [Algivirga pacifica]|uniref:Uncharacterized protein n=1 Tax=Algivirga pacifica TaxID=1162670 RepID=A0ABP9DHQ8_9BACT
MDTSIRQFFSKEVLLVISFFIFLTTALQAQEHSPKHTKDRPSTHGMLLFGNHQIYASHLPMFHSPHDYQVLLKLELSEMDKEQFLKDKAQHPHWPTYTIAPETFVLPEMINNPRPFKVSVYRGHFERGGELLLEEITVKIKEVIYFEKFNSKAEKAKSADYILLGDEQEQFLVHRISNKPDFEQIIQVKTDAVASLEDQPYRILTINEAQNSPIGVSGNRIIVGQDTVQLLEQLYLEFEDLKH